MSKPDFIIHTPEEIERIRVAAHMTAQARDRIAEFVRPGMSTKELDLIAGEVISGMGGSCAFLGYAGYPGNICISVNEEVVHGIGCRERIIQPGDVVSLDVGVQFNGAMGDTCRTVYVGDEKTMPEETARLLKGTMESLEAGIAAAVAGKFVRSISAAVENVAKKYRLAVVRDYVGHGCGIHLHEPPEVPNCVTLFHGPRLQPGMVLCIEPMLNLGTYRVKTLSNGWTVKTLDGKKSAHYEHMVLITSGQPEVLTRA